MRVEENLHIGFLENKPIIEGNGPKWLFDIDSLTQFMNYVPVAAGTIINESVGTQGKLNSGTLEEISQDCIAMPIWKDASYFDSLSKDVDNGEPKSTVDDQKQVEDGLDNENDAKDKSDDDSSPKEVNAAGQHVNTVSPDVTTGSFKLKFVLNFFKISATSVKSASTLVDLENSLVKDGDADDVDVHLYRSMIGYLMYLSASRPDIMFACKKQTVVATSTTEAEYVAAASCCGQVKHIEYLMLNASPLKHVKRGRDTKIPQSSGPPVKVGDEVVHKELGDRMERATTTTSSLEAEQDSGITTTIDRKVKITVSEGSIKRHLKLEDSKGIPFLPTAEIFEQFALIGENVKTGKARRKARIVISEDEDAIEDSSKQGRKIFDIDTDPKISLVQPQQDMEYNFDATVSIPVTTAELEINTANIAVSTADAVVTTASASISTVSPPRVSTAEDISGAETLVYIRRSASKANDKGKAIMQESEPPKKIKKRVQVKMSVDEELANKVFEEEQARFNAEHEARHKAEQEQERFDFETTLELQRQLDEREEVTAKEAHDIDWSDPSVLRYHALQNRPFSVAEIRKNMCMYLKNQGGYKMSHFKGMSYEEIRPIFESVWDQIQSFIPMDSEKEKGSEKKTGGRRKKSLARKRARETLSEESAKKQKLEDDAEKEELQILANDQYYYQIKRADGSVKHYKIFSAMLYDFDRQDVLELYRLVKDRFQTVSPEGYDLFLWVDLKTLIEPNEEDEIWRNQQDWNMINWKLHNFCRVYVLLMDIGLMIHMMVEKKYPLSQATMSKMLSRRLEVDHQSEMGYELIRFIKSQVLP
ncbi:hypothetical protein Tco_1515280 [Tanacetum coccineum]